MNSGIKKPTPSYENDSYEDINPQLNEYLDKTFFKKLENLDIRNPKILVVFSGGNAVGKSTLAREISKQLKALVIENDAVKKTIHEYLPNLNKKSLNRLTWQYTMNLYPRLKKLTPNGLVVRDGVIDWYYDRILPLFKDYRLFIIAFNLSKEEAKELIDKRGDANLTSKVRLQAILDEHFKHISNFRKSHAPDITLTKETLYDYQPVIDALRKELEKVNY